MSMSNSHSGYFFVWLQQMLEEKSEEEAENMSRPLTTMPQPLRFEVWALLQKMNAKYAYDGLNGQVCSLLERYMISCFTNTPSGGSPEWRLSIDENLNLHLHAAVCIQIVTKIDTAAERALESVGQHRNIQEIIAAHYEICEGIVYRVPGWTNVEKAQMLARQLNLLPVIVHGVRVVMDITEHHLSIVVVNVFHKVQEEYMKNKRIPGLSLVPTKQNSGHKKLLGLDLAASVVLSTWSLFGKPSPDPTYQLARWTLSSPSYIRNVSSIILDKVMYPALSQE